MIGLLSNWLFALGCGLVCWRYPYCYPVCYSLGAQTDSLSYMLHYMGAVVDEAREIRFYSFFVGLEAVSSGPR